MAVGGVSDLDRRRLRWRARRGLLENDLLIERFFQRYEQVLDASQCEALAQLLELPDNDLLDLLLARREPAAPLDSEPVRWVLSRLRAP